ncbi:MAG: DUF3795 domain-containing protein [Clostridia bacterium]|nr:DUF3795 domain-containing protein [Clostridia bacterium]
MELSICGNNCPCCGLRVLCGGCAAADGNPFGKPCFAARYIKTGGKEAFEAFKNQLATEVNRLDVPGMPPVQKLQPTNGRFVNMAYRLPGGSRVTLLKDDAVYLTCYLPCLFDESSFFSVVADMDFLLVSLCGDGSREGELLVYRKR